MLALLVAGSVSARAEGEAVALRPLTPFTPGFGNACQTRTICAAMERLGLYAGLSLQGAISEHDTGRETALGGTLSLGFDFVRRVALELHFPTAAIQSGDQPLLVAAGPLAFGARLRLGPHAPTLFSEKPQPRWALVLGTQLAFRLPRAEGDPRHVGPMALYSPQPSAHAGLELSWGPAQLVPSLSVLGEERAAYLQFGLRASLRLATSLSVDVEALSWMPASVPDEPGRCPGGSRAGLGIRGLLAHGILGVASYSVGTGGCEPTHSLTLGVTFAFGEHPLRKIPTADEVGVQRFWLGMVDPVLDCNGWMLDDESLLPRFQFGDPIPGTDLIRRGDEVFRVGEHFDIDRSGRLYRPHQYVAIAGEHAFKEASVREKLALPECSVGPRHRYHTECRILRDTIEQSLAPATIDPMFGRTGPMAMALQFKSKCLSDEEADNPRKLLGDLLDIASTRGLRPAMGLNPAVPPGGRAANNQPDRTRGDTAEHTTQPGLYRSQFLRDNEAKGGHVLEKHVGKTDEQLVARLRQEPRLPAASTFQNEATAEQAIKQTIEKNQEQIKQWLAADSSKPLALDHGFQRTIGRGIDRSEMKVTERSTAIVVLKKDNGGFYVLTAYVE